MFLELGHQVTHSVFPEHHEEHRCEGDGHVTNASRCGGDRQETLCISHVEANKNGLSKAYGEEVPVGGPEKYIPDKGLRVVGKDTLHTDGAVESVTQGEEVLKLDHFLSIHCERRN